MRTTSNEAPERNGVDEHHMSSHMIRFSRITFADFALLWCFPAGSAGRAVDTITIRTNNGVTEGQTPIDRNVDQRKAENELLPRFTIQTSFAVLRTLRRITNRPRFTPMIRFIPTSSRGRRSMILCPTDPFNNPSHAELLVRQATCSKLQTIA
jgi:hypothetical protein